MSPYRGDRETASARIVGMASSAEEKIFEAALALTGEERERLVDRLLDTLDEPPEDVVAAWNETLARRSAEVASGAVKLVPGEKVVEAVEELLAELRSK